MDEPQPATQNPGPTGQPPRGARPPRPAGPGPRPPRPAGRPALRPPPPVGAPPVDLYARLLGAVQAVRAVRLFRTSSAVVRWVILVVAIGTGAALLIALAVQALTSLIPSSSGG